MKTFIALMLSGVSVLADISGTVLLPNGQPAAGAQVALAIPNYSLNLAHAKMRGNHGDKTPLVVADRDGRFSLPANESEWAIVAMNESGCSQVERKEFVNGSQITLQTWARIEGVLRIGNGIGTNKQVVLGAPGPARFFFELQSFEDKTDRDGKFVFTCVPSGTWNITHSGEPFWDGEKITVKAGETNRVTIGGTGRPVIGRLLIPTTLTNEAGHASVPSGRGYLQFSDSATNRRALRGVHVTLYGNHRELTAQMSLDGSFRMEDVPAGTWWLHADILSFPPGGGSATTRATAGKKIIVPEMSGGRSDEPMDLGTVEPVLARSPQIGEAAPALEVKTVDGETFNLAGHRGQFVLLDFEPLDYWSLHTTQTNASVQAAWATFGKSDRLAMLSLIVPPLHSYSYITFTNANTGYSWPQARLNIPWHEVKSLIASYGLHCDRSMVADTNLPSILLVGPDGRIVARDLHGDEIKAALAKALREN